MASVVIAVVALHALVVQSCCPFWKKLRRQRQRCPPPPKQQKQQQKTPSNPPNPAACALSCKRSLLWSAVPPRMAMSVGREAWSLPLSPYARPTRSP
eukprot:256196-Rhodomonas_salina.2